MLTLLLACNPPPPAPEGLDDSTSYMVREFYSDDATFQAGVQGFLAWFDEEGHELVGVGADGSNTDSFSVGVLTDEDVARLPLADQVLIDGENDVWEDRDVGAAKGVVSLAEMDCDYLTAEDFLVRPDQNDVFDAFEGYERTYKNSLEVFNQATDELSFTPITDELTVWGGDFAYEDYARSILFTENMADPDVFAGVNVEPYQLFLDVRHGVFDLTDQDSGETTPTGVFAILTYITAAAFDATEANGLLQSYSVEINVERPGNKTLRMLAVWAEPRTILNLEPDDPLVLNQSVGTALDQSEQLDEKCSDWAAENPVESSSCSAAGGAPSAGWLGLLVLPMLRRRRR